MRDVLRVFIAGCFYYSGLVKLVLWLRQGGSRRRLVILNYHRAGGNLSDQMRYLRRDYRIMHLEEALEEFYASPSSREEKRKRDRRIPLVLTFDDGYVDNYRYAFPLARRFQIPYTVFVIPGYVESGQHFWWLAAKRLVTSATVANVTLENRTYSLAQTDDRVALTIAVDRQIRFSKSVAEREATIVQLEQVLGFALPSRATADPEDFALSITWEEMREMDASGLVSFGSHTMHHPILGYLIDPAEVCREIAASRQVLEEQLHHPIRAFAYPVGKLQHIGELGVRAVKEAGFKWAVTTMEEPNTLQTNPYLLQRVPGDITAHWLVMAAELAGLLGFVSRFRKTYERLFGK